MEYTIETVFNRVLEREMDVLLTEKAKMCQSGVVIDLATNRLVDAYYLKSQYVDMKKSRDFERSCYEMARDERDRYQKLLREERGK